MGLTASFLSLPNIEAININIIRSDNRLTGIAYQPAKLYGRKSRAFNFGQIATDANEA